MRFDNEFAAVEEGAVEVENSELHWNDSDGWITEQTPRVYSSFERLLPLIRLSTNVGIGSNCEELSVSKCLPVYDKRTFSASVGMSQRCQHRK